LPTDTPISDASKNCFPSCYRFGKERRVICTAPAETGEILSPRYRFGEERSVICTAPAAIEQTFSSCYKTTVGPICPGHRSEVTKNYLKKSKPLCPSSSSACYSWVGGLSALHCEHLPDTEPSKPPSIEPWFLLARAPKESVEDDSRSTCCAQ